MDGNTGNIIVAQLDLTGVKSGADLYPEFSSTVANGARATHRPNWTIESAQDPVACALDYPPSKPVHLAVDESVTLIEQIPPSTVSNFRGLWVPKMSSTALTRDYSALGCTNNNVGNRDQ